MLGIQGEAPRLKRLLKYPKHLRSATLGIRIFQRIHSHYEILILLDPVFTDLSVFSLHSRPLFSSAHEFVPMSASA